MKIEIRSTILTASAVLGCFVVGWGGARLFGDGATAGESQKAAAVGDFAPTQAASAESRGPGVAAREWGEALAAFGKGSGGMAADHALAAALLRMEAGDFPASAEGVLEALAKNARPMDLRAAALAEAWLGRWLELDAPGALRFLETSPFLTTLPTTPMQGWSLAGQIQCGLGGVFTALARKQPEWLKQYLARLQEGPTRKIGMYALLRGLAQGDVERARRVLMDLPKGKDRAAALEGFVPELARTNPMEAINLTRSELDGPQRLELMRAVFDRTGLSGLNGVKALLDQITDPKVRRNCVVFALSAVAFDGRNNLLPFVKDESARMAAELGENADFPGWARYLPYAAKGAQARAFAEWTLEFSADKNGEMLQHIARNWASQSPEEFAAWVRERAGALDAAQVTKLSAVIGALTYNVEAARTLSEALPAGPLRDQARFQVAMEAGKKGDFTQAMEAYRSVAPTDAKGTLAGRLAGVLVGMDGAVAADWAGQQPPGKARDEALRVVAELWSMRDVRGAAQWLETLPAGAERDRAVRTYATTVVVADAQAASEWVSQVADPLVRRKTAETVFERWSIQDPVAARAWLGSLGGGLLEKFMRNAK